jgi:hypothetical protein
VAAEHVDPVATRRAMIGQSGSHRRPVTSAWSSSAREERVLLFCLASGTDWERAGSTRLWPRHWNSRIAITLTKVTEIENKPSPAICLPS